jgi:hypothetical protein
MIADTSRRQFRRAAVAYSTQALFPVDTACQAGSTGEGVHSGLIDVFPHFYTEAGVKHSGDSGGGACEQADSL